MSCCLLQFCCMDSYSFSSSHTPKTRHTLDEDCEHTFSSPLSPNLNEASTYNKGVVYMNISPLSTNLYTEVPTILSEDNLEQQRNTVHMFQYYTIHLLVHWVSRHPILSLSPTFPISEKDKYCCKLICTIYCVTINAQISGPLT